MGGHTPGPWQYVADMKFGPSVYFGFHAGGFSLHPLTPNAEANARLIAAAPELLEACKDARLVLSSHVEHCDGGVIDRLDRIIKKAEGE